MTLASRLAAGETLFTAWSGVPDSLTVEIMALQPFDAVTLDMQHGGHHEDSVLRGAAAGAAGRASTRWCAFRSGASTWRAGRSISAPRR